jgi:hypothetical protein
MLELLIALFLVGVFALPMAQFPMQAMQEEYRSAYRMQSQRLADLAFAEIKEQLYKQEIAWEKIVSPANEKAVILEDDVEISFDFLGKRTFNRLATIHSTGKKGADSNEYRLATVRIKMTPAEKKPKLFRSKKNRVESRVYTYQVLLSKSLQKFHTG